MRASAALLWWLGLCACAGGGSAAQEQEAGTPQDAAVAEDAAPAQPAPLVHAALWQPLSAADDPWASDGGAASCAPESFGEEYLGGELVFYVRTDACPALTVRQPSRAPLRAGQTLEIRLYHFPLIAPEPATAVLIVQLGDTQVWQRELPIPSADEQISEHWQADDDYPAGTPVLFHVHNHGSNEYTLIGVDAL